MIRIGIIGKRGLAYAPGIRSMSGVEITALAEADPEARQRGAADYGIPQTFDDLEPLLESVAAVVIGSPMHLHATQSLAALNAGKFVLSEVTAAVSEEECQKLAAHPARDRYFFAENYAYFEENLMVEAMARQGLFGELYFGEGQYLHEVRFLHRNPDGSPTWRMRWQVGVPGNTYITHELGPLMRWFRAADPSVRIASVACYGSGVRTDPSLNHDDVSLTVMKLSNGALLEARLDMVSNRPHRIAYALQGTQGVYESEGGGRIWRGENRTVGWDDPPREWEALAPVRERFLSRSLLQELGQAQSHGHGGGDYMVGRRFAQFVSDGSPAEIGMQEAVEWTVAGLLSQASIANGSQPIPMPDWAR